MEILTERQLKFCEEYAKTGNGTRSYMAAYPQKNEDYAARSAIALLRQDKIKEYIHFLADKNANDKIADLAECLELITDIMRDPTSTKTEKMKASDMRIKTLGGYIDNKKIDANVNAQVVINDDYTED